MMSREAKRAAVTKTLRVPPPVSTSISETAYRPGRDTIADFNGSIRAQGYAQQEHAERSPECGRETPALGIYHISASTPIAVLRL